MRTLIVVPLICLLLPITHVWEAAAARMCPSPPEFVIIWRCMNGASDVGQIERCAGRWGSDRLWNCIRSDPALSKLTLDDLRAQTPAIRPATPAPPSPPPTRSLSCPELAHRVARAIEDEHPGAKPAVKGIALQQMMAMFGCGALPTPPPAIQTADCVWIGGIFTCTTR